MRYDAFISYNHGADGGIAPYLQDALQRIAMPWYRRRGMAVFRDYTDLPVDADLAEVIESGLDDSRYYVLIASPGSRDSKWVGQEIDHWLATKTAARKRIVLVLTDGEINLDDAREIDYDTSTALHEQMRGRFAKAPLYIDLSTARQKIDDGTLTRRQFRREYRHDVALVAARVKEVTVRDVIDDDAKFQHRKLLLAWSAAAMLMLLAVASGILAIVASNNAEEARTQASNARSLGLASQSSTAMGQDPPQGLALALASNGQATTEIGHRALQTAVASPIWRVIGPAVRNSFTDPAPTAMSRRGSLVAAGDGADRIKVWNTATPRHPAALEAPGAIESTGIAFRPDETQLAATFLVPPADESGSYQGRLVIWDFSKTVAVVDVTTPAQLLGVAWSPDGRFVAAGDVDGNVRLWNADGSDPRTIATGSPVVVSVAFGPDSRLVGATTGGASRADEGAGKVVMVDTSLGVPVRTIPVDSSVVLSGTFSADGTSFFSGDDDGNVGKWDVGTGARQKSWSDNGPVVSVATDKSGLVVSGDRDGGVIVRDPDGLERTRWNEGTTVSAIAFSANGRRLATGNDRGRITIRETARLPNAYRAGDAVQTLAFAPDGFDLISFSQAATGNSPAPGTANVLDRASNSFRPLREGLHPTEVAVSADGKVAALVVSQSAPAGERNQVTVLDVGTGATISTREVDGTFRESALAPDGSALLAVVVRKHEDHILGWDTATAKKVFDRPTGPDSGNSGDPSVRTHIAASGQTFVIALANGDVLSVSATDDTPRVLHQRGVTTHQVVASPNGTTIAVFVDTEGVGATTDIRLWNLEDRTRRSISTSTRGGTPTAAAFSADGTKLAVGDDKSRVTLYDIADPHEITKITEWDVSGAVTSIAFSQNGQTLAAADDLGRVETWDSSSWQSSDAALVGQLCRRLSGYEPIRADWLAVDPYSRYADLCRDER